RPCALSLHYGTRHIRTALGRRIESHFLRLCVREHGDGDGSAAGGRRPATIHQLRRHSHGDPHGWFRYSHVALCKTQTRRPLTSKSQALGRCPSNSMASRELVLRAYFAFLVSCLAFPALALDITRPEVRAFIDEMSTVHGFARSEVEALLAQAKTQQSILDAISRPAERVVPWYEYRERFLTEQRIQQGADFWMAHGERLRSLGDERLASTIVGILGVETAFGRITGRYRVIDALATLAFDYPPRAQFFRGELVQFLLLTREENVDARKALGSYAGAMGAPQFISTSYRKFAVDADGDGKRDLWNSWDDIIGSIANYLHGHG